MPTYDVKFYADNPANILTTAQGSTFTWSGATTATGTATILDEENGIQGKTLDDDSNGGETASATNVQINGLTSGSSPVDAEIVWTVRDTVTGEIFQIVQLDVEQQGAAGQYTLSEVPLVFGREYQVLNHNSNPNAANAAESNFRYDDHIQNFANEDFARVVEGTSEGESITSGYLGDPQGDAPDDNGGGGPDGYDDIIDGFAGDDTIAGGAGADLIFGGEDKDTISGGAGNDTIYGDGPEATAVQESLNWSKIAGDGFNLSQGLTQDTGTMNVSVSFQSTGDNAPEYAVESTDTAYVSGSDPMDPKSNLRLFGRGQGDTSKTTIDFSASTGSGMSSEVENVQFRINDIDWGDQNHRDVVTVKAYDDEGNAVEVTITPGAGDTLSGDANSGYTVTADNTSQAQSDAAGSALVQIAGPVSKIEIIYSNPLAPSGGFPGEHALWVSDIYFDATPMTGDADIIDGGAGDDAMFGGDGADTFTFSDGFGNDTVEGGEGGTDYDTLDFSNLTAAVSGTYSGDEAATISDGTSSVSFTEVEHLVLTAQNDTIDASADSVGVDIDAGAGNDTITGGSGDDVIRGDVGGEPAWSYTAYDYDFTDANGQAFDMENGTVSGTGTTDSFDVASLIHETRGTAGDPNDFGILLTSTIAPNETGTYSFDLTSDDGSTLQIFDADGNPVAVVNGDGTVTTYLNNDYHQGETTRSGEVTLEAGQVYTIEVRYWENGGGNVLKGTVTGPSGTTEDLATSSLLLPAETASGNDIINGGAGNDLIYGQGGDDTINGGTGDDIINAGDGADTIVLTDNYGTDTVIGGEGGTDTDTLDMSALTAGVTGTYSGDEEGSVTQGTNTVSFSEVEVLDLTDHDDVIDASADTLGTTINAGGGDDVITGGTGNDVIDGGTGDDILDGGAGNDTLWGGDGADTLTGGEGVNSLNGGAGNDTFIAGAGADTFNAGSGQDTVDYSASTGPVSVDLGAGTYAGGDAANDSGSGVDGLIGSAFDDTLIGFDGESTTPGSEYTNIFYGGEGNDLLDGKGGADELYGDAGNDTIIGGTGADTLGGGIGNDTLHVAEGDTATGGDGDDLFLLSDLGEAGAADITIVGGEGDETAGDTLDFQGLIGFGDVTYTNTDDSAGGLSGFATMADGSVVNFSEIENVIICFATGTRILTPYGERAVESLKQGDLVITADNGLQPIRWVGKREVPAVGKLAPIRIRKNVLGNDRDLLVSPQHRMLRTGFDTELLFGQNEVLIPAVHMLNGTDVMREEGGTVTYVHLLFDHHEVIFAEGAASESYHPGHVGLDGILDPAREELFRVFPELRSDIGSYGPTSRLCLKKHEARALTAA
ncbi:Hint domain-containing protein [Actibacterium lipolyticum]|uniref:Bifunctional hemolysin/adenylate cyclase n=1 Tax=Actibacterium lipolyticum TaxID=1524263 RepID=A0A238JUV7_9RHOB|nr:Hint domain-containing protein [Actibacterium lipolyticum]SMX33964.1 Bifunctional hemolysin/adenylate cyclase precursor [Actibacterium lipolyticum]